MPRIGDDIKELILRSVVGKTGVESRHTMQALHEMTGLSVGHLYRISAQYRAAKRATRKDAGQRRIDVSDEQLDGLLRLTVNYNLDARRVLDIAGMNGLAPGGLSASGYNRLIRERGVTRRRMAGDPEPTVIFEGRWPNDIHHFDATKLEHLHYDSESKLITFDPRRNYKNSRGEKAQPVWLYLIVDDFSRAEFAALYLDLNHYNHLDFIYRAWAQKQNQSEFPFYGIPNHIYMDKGGGNQSLKFLSALATLGCHVIPTTPSTNAANGARKHGKVESAFRFYNAWEQEFQLSRPLSWEEAETFLYERLLWRNRRRHSQTLEVPFQRWLRVETPHNVPGEEFYRTLCYDRWTREVDNRLTISLDGQIYKLPEHKPSNNWVGEKVQVYAARGDRAEVICVRDGKEVVAKKITRAELVRPAFHYKPEDDSEPTSISEARAKATGTYGPMQLWESDDKAPAYLPRRGVEFDDSKIKLAGPPSGVGVQNLSPAPENRDIKFWLSRIQAMQTLVTLGVFEPGPRSAADINFVDLLMSGRDKIEYDEVDAAAKLFHQSQRREES